MRQPKMILFDYGHTLLYEPCFDFLRGERALMPYITKNPMNLSAEDITVFSNTLFEDWGGARRLGLELHERQFQRLVYESLGIELSVSYDEAERIKWDAISPGAVMPGADTMLDELAARGIRSGVVSNIGWSGMALRERIERLLPRNRFEFIIASSEYGVRKPSAYLFALALQKAALTPGEVWFCGDNARADIEGSAAAGMFPVWYQEQTVEIPWRERDAGLEPMCGHMRIQDWSELIQALDKLVAK